MIGMHLAVIALVSYVVGTIPFGRVLTWLPVGRGRDVTRVMIVSKVLIDMMKGLVVVALGSTFSTLAALIALFGVFFGHNFPVCKRIQGGNGLAALAGGLVALDPVLGLFGIIGWLAGYFVLRTAHGAAIVTAIATPLAATQTDLGFPVYFLFPIMGIIIWKHRNRIFAAEQAESVSA